MKILIAVPTFENIYPDTFKSIYDLDPCGNELSFDFVRGYDCATARNNIARKAMDGNFEYVLMVDNDVVLPKDALKYLTEDLKPVTLGYYAHRNSKNQVDGTTCVCKLGEFNYTNRFSVEELTKLRELGTTKLPIHGGGMGCAFIKVSIFKSIDYPWFDWVNYKDFGLLSEDLYFCEMCKSKNIPIYTDTRCGCGHIFRYVQKVI